MNECVERIEKGQGGRRMVRRGACGPSETPAEDALGTALLVMLSLCLSPMGPLEAFRQ